MFNKFAADDDIKTVVPNRNVAGKAAECLLVDRLVQRGQPFGNAIQTGQFIRRINGLENAPPRGRCCTPRPELFLHVSENGLASAGSGRA